MKRLLLSLTILAMLGGCAIYGTTPAYYDDGARVYVAPPVYVAPRVYADPWYAGPPIFFNFGYRSWGGGGHHRWHGGGHHRGGRGGWHHGR
ncbi:MAG TPA: hypothetical protein VIP51_12605 [Eoetvoesiella sp.]